MTKPDLKTSAEWSLEFPELIVVDFNGWDSQNMKFSWGEEQISKEEFLKRRTFSTCKWGHRKEKTKA